MWSSFTEAHILKKAFSFPHMHLASESVSGLPRSFQICCGDILQDLQVPLLCFSESFPWGVIAVPVEVVVKLIFTLHGWKGGRKAPFVYIWVSGADCEPLAGRGDVTGSGEPANGSSPPISGDGCSVGNYEHSVGALLSAGVTASLRAGPACWTVLVFYFKQIWLFPRRFSCDPFHAIILWQRGHLAEHFLFYWRSGGTVGSHV